eukprot:Opistho-1_new@84240
MHRPIRGAELLVEALDDKFGADLSHGRLEVDVNVADDVSGARRAVRNAILRGTHVTVVGPQQIVGKPDGVLDERHAGTEAVVVHHLHLQLLDNLLHGVLPSKTPPSNGIVSERLHVHGKLRRRVRVPPRNIVATGAVSRLHARPPVLRLQERKRVHRRVQVPVRRDACPRDEVSPVVWQARPRQRLVNLVAEPLVRVVARADLVDGGVLARVEPVRGMLRRQEPALVLQAVGPRPAALSEGSDLVVGRRAGRAYEHRRRGMLPRSIARSLLSLRNDTVHCEVPPAVAGHRGNHFRRAVADCDLADHVEVAHDVGTETRNRQGVPCTLR